MDKMRQLEHLCGIDVGGTNVKMAAVVHGRLFEKMIPSGDTFTQDALIDSISLFCESFNTNFHGIGIAFTGSTTDGLSVCRTPLPCLENLRVQDFYHLSHKVSFINDANASTLAGLFEFPDSKVLVSVTSGTGIGSGIAINGEIFSGANGFAGEIYGNPFVKDSFDSKKVGKVCSGSKILKHLQDPNKTVSNESIVFEASQYMGSVLVSLIHTLNPDVLYLTGGGFNFPNFFDYVMRYIQKRTYPYFLDGLKIASSEFGSLAGCVGAMCNVNKIFFPKSESKNR